MLGNAPRLVSQPFGAYATITDLTTAINTWIRDTANEGRTVIEIQYLVNSGNASPFNAILIYSL